MGWIVLTIFALLIVIPAIGYAIWSKESGPVEKWEASDGKIGLRGPPTTRSSVGASPD